MYSALNLLPEKRSGFVFMINGEGSRARAVLNAALVKQFTAPRRCSIGRVVHRGIEGGGPKLRVNIRTRAHETADAAAGHTGIPASDGSGAIGIRGSARSRFASATGTCASTR
jgi:hypothetical protein